MTPIRMYMYPSQTVITQKPIIKVWRGVGITSTWYVSYREEKSSSYESGYVRYVKRVEKSTGTAKERDSKR